MDGPEETYEINNRIHSLTGRGPVLLKKRIGTEQEF